MAIETAGQKPAKATKLKIDNQASFDLPKDTTEQIYKILLNRDIFIYTNSK